MTRIKAVGVTGGLLGLLLLAGWSFAQRRSDLARPETLLPANAVLCYVSEGTLLHGEAYRKTAAFQALEESGLMETVRRMVAAVSNAAPQAGLAWEAVQHLQEKGLSLAIALDSPGQGPPLPWGIVVVHQAADGGVEGVKGLLAMIPDVQLHFQDERIRGRRVQKAIIPFTPAELGLWTEGGHLIIAFGIDAVNSAIAVAEKDRENLTASQMWEWYAPSHQTFDANTVAWLNLSPLRELFGPLPVPIPVPGADPGQPVTVNDILAWLGIQNLNHVAMVSGYQGKNLWSEVIVDAPNDGSGQIPINWSDLPPIPVGQSGIVVSSVDWEHAYDNFLVGIRNISRVMPGAEGQIEQVLGDVERELGFNPRDLCASLGHINCLYSDGMQGMFGMGTTAMISVDDQVKTARYLDLIINRIQREAGEHATFTQVEKQGRTLTVVEFPQVPFVSPTFCVDTDWLIIGLGPQAVEAALLRLDGKLPAWQPEGEVAAALQELPDEFTSLTIADPRDTYRFLVGFAPTLLGMAQLGMRESGQFPPDFRLPLSVTDFPPTELVVGPLYPNVMMTTADKSGLHFYSRQSLPGIPLIGGGSSGSTTVATTSILVALLLPAVQQAREAARRAQSRNNLKQIGLAMHHYHDVFGYFPQGTIPNDGLDPDERLSWLVAILPFIDQAPLYNVIARDAGWEAAGNARAVNTQLPILLHPSEPVNLDADGRPVTHYLGVAGLGKEGPNLPVTDKKAGLFAYNRVTRIQDIRDGTSNTIAVGEARKDFGAWAAGGAATIRPLTEKPYINGPDGFGSRSTGGSHFLLADGAVRFVSENIDPSVMEALTTINGGERIGGF